MPEHPVRLRILLPLIAMLAPLAVAASAHAQVRDTVEAPRAVVIPPLYPRYYNPYRPPAPDTTGLRFHLGELREGDREPARAPVSSRPLTPAEARAVFARLRPIRPGASPADSFAFPARTLAPPRAGRTVSDAFPTRDSTGARPRPPVRTAATLEVARRAPEGAVDREAPEVTITFTQPMVPLSSVGVVRGQAVPVRLTPQPAGEWRWLDTRTLRFTAPSALPAATDYTVEIPAGTRAANGLVLAEAVRWRFWTPAPKAVGAYPTGYGAFQPVLVIAFDQRVDPAAVLRVARARTADSADVPLRLATPEEVAADTAAANLTARLRPGEWVALRPVALIPRNVGVRVSLAPGLPGAEGPRVTETMQYWEFRTHGPFRLVSAECDSCVARQPIVIRLSSLADPRTFRQSMVRAEPAIDGLQAWVGGDLLVIHGNTRPHTRYTVTVDSAFRDVFGQRLEAPGRIEVKVGMPYASIGAPRDVLVLDPRGPRAVTVMTVGHERMRLRVTRVRPEDWFAFRDLMFTSRRPAPLPGVVVVDREITVDASDGEAHPVDVDLSPALSGGVGQVVVAMEALDGEGEWTRRDAAYVWAQATGIGVGAFSDADRLTAWATSLVDGRPVTGARVELIGRDTIDRGRTRLLGSAETDARGVGTLPLATGGTMEQRVLVIRQGGDVATLSPEMLERWAGTWVRVTTPPRRAWNGFTDRTLYRPGEEVRFKGWVRTLAPGVDGGPSLPAASLRGVRWIAYDGRENEIARGRSALTPLGGFDGTFTVPAGANLGNAHIQLLPELPDRVEPSYTAIDPPGVGAVRMRDLQESWIARITYRIDEFRRPEYEVTATASEGPLFVGGTAEITAQASYFSGGALPGAPVTWAVTAQPGGFDPPGWDGWSFGDPHGGTREDTLQAATDARGRSGVRVALDRNDQPSTYVVTAEATVTDVNRQTWTSNARVLVHPASVYAGLRVTRPWLSRGDTIRMRVIVTDLDGRAVPGRVVEVRATGRAWRQEAGQWREIAVDSAQAPCTVTSAARPVECAFAAAQAGSYLLSATLRDERGRLNRTATRVWVTGPDAFFGPPRETDGGRGVELQADRESYAVGDTAAVMVRTRFFPSRGVITFRRNGLAKTESIRVDGNTGLFRVPITEADIPNLVVGVDLIGAGADSVRGVHQASATISLPVPPATRKLTVTAAPRDSVAMPDGPASVSLRVTDAAGRPVRDAEVALAVVDEAVLALANAPLPDPLRAFYPNRGGELRWVGGRELVWLPQPDFAPAPGTVVGRVMNAATGGYVAEALVQLMGSARSVMTDQAGRFRITGVAPGHYVVLVQAGGLGQARAPVEVADSATAPAPVYVTMYPEQTRIRIRGASTLSLSGLVANAMGVSERRMGMVAGKAAGARIGADGTPIAVRSNFSPLAVFTPSVRTGADGRAVVPFTMPSNLTRYRIIAVAVQGGTRYGTGEGVITARRPLMVRPSAPRFLNWGDRFELPVVIQNQSGQPVQADVAVRGSGIDVADAGSRVTIPANDRVEVRLHAFAARAGEAVLQIAAASPSGLSDAAEITLPVYTPATAEAFATYGTFAADSSVALPLRVPMDAIPDFGGLEISASSTALQELTDALLYLVRYPYECSEQVASRLLGVTALRDVVAAFGGSDVPAAEALRASVQRDIRTLASRQDEGGATGFWEKDDYEIPYVSIHAAHALQRAREKGYDVPSQALEQALEYLRGVPENVPSWYPEDVKRALHAYAIYVRARMADTTAANEIRQWIATTPRSEIRIEEAGWLLSAAGRNPASSTERAEMLRIINNAATETASTATFATRYTDGEYLLMHSNRRTDGVVLEALLAADPANPLISKTVRGLLGHRVSGRWNNTQENGWILIALDRYFRAFEGVTPDFVARVWLGDRYAGGHPFAGRQADPWALDIPMRVLQARDSTDVVIATEGRGRVYYRAGLRYAPRNLDLPPLDAGFTVTRRYDAVDDAGDVRQDSAGTWHVRAGARVRVTLTMVAPARRLHVALADPLPAGFEPVNPELGRSASAPRQSDEGTGDWNWWRSRYWYQHQNLRDQRAEAFTSLLPAGSYTWSYVARATTPGTFVAPPPKAEEMYSPETFGRGASDRVIVETR